MKMSALEDEEKMSLIPNPLLRSSGCRFSFGIREDA
jgi:hypothetical protein